MNAPDNFTRIVGRTRYSTATATLIASDEYWDGHNHERSGRNTFLYRTAKGTYFTVQLSQWQGEGHTLTPVSQDGAISLYEGPLSEHAVNYAEAFPDVDVQDA